MDLTWPDSVTCKNNKVEMWMTDMIDTHENRADMMEIQLVAI